MFVAKDNTLECVVKRSSGNEYSMSINNEHQVFTSAPVPVYGEWTHVVMTWTNTNLTLDVRKLYLNGELVDTYSGSGAYPANALWMTVVRSLGYSCTR